jgi:hypothetical protein
MTSYDLPPLQTRPLFSMRLAVDGLLSIGRADDVQRRIGNIPGGAFEGERLRGTVLSGGTDWQIVRGDGAVELDGRIVLQTNDGVLIAMTYVGLRHGPPDVMARLGREVVDPSAYYFRIVPRFTTSDPGYVWLNRIVAVGVGHRLPEGPSYFVHEIL